LIPWTSTTLPIRSAPTARPWSSSSISNTWWSA